MPQTLTAMFGREISSISQAQSLKEQKVEMRKTLSPNDFLPTSREYCTDAAISASQLTVASSVGVEWHSSRNSRNFMIAAS